MQKLFQIMELTQKCEQKDRKEVRAPKELNVEQLSRVPIRCPLSGCLATISSLDILCHMLIQHLRPSPGKEELHLAYENERCILLFDLSRLPPRKTICLGVLLYCGKRDHPDGLPGKRGLCHLNRFLPEAENELLLAEYLPVVILVRRCYFFEWLDKKKKDPAPVFEDMSDWTRKNVTYEADKDELDMFLFWTQSVSCTRPLHVTMTAYDRTMSECRSGFRQVVNSGMIRPESDGKELPKSKHALWVTCSEMEQMGKGKGGDKKSVNLELILHEGVKTAV